MTELSPEAKQAAAELRELLDLTAEQHRIKRRIDLVRARVDARARSEYDTTEVAPTWKMPKLGQIRLDGCGGDPVPYVTDDDVLTGFIAQRTPDDVVATITVPSHKLTDALEVLGFADVHATATVTARPAAVEALLKHATLVDAWEDVPEGEPKPEPRWFAVDAEGEVLPGVAGRLASAPRLVVAVDPAFKAKVTAEADAEDAEHFPTLTTDSIPETESEAS